MNAPRLAGVLAPLVTPFDDRLAPDVPRWIAHAKWILSQRAGLAPFGTTSEANSLSLAERESMLDRLIEAGVPPKRVLPGTGACALPDAIALTRRAVALGCAGVLMLPPFYYKGMSDDGLAEFYARVIDGVASDALRIYLYHIPAVSGVPVTMPLIETLRSRFPDSIAGIKDSSGDWANTEALIRNFPGFDVFPGNELNLVRAMKTGAVGCISATANVNPAALADVAADPSAADAIERQDVLDRVRTTMQRRPMIPALKALIAEATGVASWANVRPPFLPLPEAERTTLVNELRRAGFSLSIAPVAA